MSLNIFFFLQNTCDSFLDFLESPLKRPFEVLLQWQENPIKGVPKGTPTYVTFTQIKIRKQL